MDKMSGVVVSAEQTGTTKSGWKNWVAVFENGESVKFAMPPDSAVEPTKGETLNLYKGKYGWLLDTRVAEGGNGTVTSDDYWKNKYDYEVKERDPKIEFQTYFAKVCEIYAASVGTLKPKSIEEVDELLDRAMTKAKELYQHVQLSKN